MDEGYHNRQGEGRCLGLDVGHKIIGVAISDPLRLTARPLTSIRYRVVDAAVQRIRDICVGEEISLLVVGRPLRLSGEESTITAVVDNLIEVIRKVVQIPIVLAEERLSSKEAEKLMAEHGIDSSRRRELRDQYAAALILQWYLEERRD